MPKEEQTITVNVRFCNVEVCPDERYEYRVEEVVEKFVKDLCTFVEIRSWDFLAFWLGRPQPVYVCDLKWLLISTSQAESIVAITFIPWDTS
jgi:hypothetical protein